MRAQTVTYLVAAAIWPALGHSQVLSNVQQTAFARSWAVLGTTTVFDETDTGPGNGIRHVGPDFFDPVSGSFLSSEAGEASYYSGADRITWNQGIEMVNTANLAHQAESQVWRTFDFTLLSRSDVSGQVGVSVLSRSGDNTMVGNRLTLADSTGSTVFVQRNDFFTVGPLFQTVLDPGQYRLTIELLGRTWNPVDYDGSVLVTSLGYVDFGAVPEPATAFAFGCAALGAAISRRRRRFENSITPRD